MNYYHFVSFSYFKNKRTLLFSYPVPYLHRDEHIHSFDSFLLQHGIYSRGRFGAWKYEVANQDHSCAQGVEASKEIVAFFYGKISTLNFLFILLVLKFVFVEGNRWSSSP